MSLKAKYKTNSKLVNEGVWFDVDKNADGSLCRVKLRRPGRGNKLWGIAFRKYTADKDMENITPEEDELLTAQIFAEANVADWENFQPEDDGVNVPFSVEKAAEILSDPDWISLLADWQNKANQITPFQKEKREKEAKN